MGSGFSAPGEGFFSSPVQSTLGFLPTHASCPWPVGISPPVFGGVGAHDGDAVTKGTVVGAGFPLITSRI